MYIHRKRNPTYMLVFVLIFVVVSAEERWCKDREREALLRFKQGLRDDYGCLSSWGSESDNEECCDWDHVYCNNTSGQVTYLDLSACYIRGNLSSDLLELHHLKYLDLTSNQFGGRIPNFIGSMKSLEAILFMDNNFSGTIPHQLGNLTNLQILTLNYNFLVHKIPHSFRNLTNLQILYINVNELGEPLADFFGKLSSKSLEKIDISLNKYKGKIPDLRAFSNLSDFKIHHNPLSGSLPASLGQLSKLDSIDASYNSLQGTISEAHFSKLHKLRTFDVSFNSLTVDFSPDWIPPFRLNMLDLSTCKMGPSFPKWLKTQNNLSTLDISNAGISDRVPDWLWSLSPYVRVLNISYNQISGRIPDLSSNFFDLIDVSYNNFSGPLPLLHPNISFAHFGHNMFNGTISFICQVIRDKLEFLDLSNNQLTGSLPKCWRNTRSLISLNLNDNSLFGEIPHAFGSLQSLETLLLRGNNLTGELPPTMRSCRKLVLIDIGGNKLTGEIPQWLGDELKNMTHLSFRRNKFYGMIPPDICSLTHIRMLDLSGNDISGEIPRCFDNFTSLVEKGGDSAGSLSFIIDYMRSYFAYVEVQWKGQDKEYKKPLRLLKLIDLSSNRLTGSIPNAVSSLKGLISLNLSTNRLTGKIDPDISQMEMLETLDLSDNQLSGKIPVGLAQLHFLGVLDLANNKLTGEIPRGTQLQGFNASSYSGNNGLCGPPLLLCPNTSISTTAQGENIKKKNGGFMRVFIQQELYIPVTLGLIVGFWGVVGSLVLKRSWRNAYYGFIDDVRDWFYVTVNVYMAKFRQS